MKMKSTKTASASIIRSRRAQPPSLLRHERPNQAIFISHNRCMVCSAAGPCIRGGSGLHGCTCMRGKIAVSTCTGPGSCTFVTQVTSLAQIRAIDRPDTGLTACVQQDWTAPEKRSLRVCMHNLAGAQPRVRNDVTLANHPEACVQLSPWLLPTSCCLRNLARALCVADYEMRSLHATHARRPVRDRCGSKHVLLAELGRDGRRGAAFTIVLHCERPQGSRGMTEV